MQRYAALLRGITPSGRNMTNDKLRGVFERLGFTDVASVLASGNIVFSAPEQDAPALEQRIQSALVADLGIPGGTIIRALPELAALRADDPFAGVVHGTGTYLTATFLKDAARILPDPPPGEGTTRVLRSQPGVLFAVTDNTEPGRTQGWMAWLDQQVGKDNTTRSWPTVGKIVAALER